jgi:hypothetical protein
MQTIAKTAIATISGVAIGLVSALVKLDSAGSHAVIGHANWQEIDVSANALQLIYALGHFQVAGQVPPSTSLRQLQRLRDEDGNRLSASCVFVLEGKIPKARWWTIAATSDATTVDENVISSGQAITDADGLLRVSVARSPVAGNWIIPPDGRYAIVLTLHDPVDVQTMVLPLVRQGRC